MRSASPALAPDAAIVLGIASTALALAYTLELSAERLFSGSVWCR